MSNLSSLELPVELQQRDRARRQSTNEEPATLSAYAIDCLLNIED